MGLEEGFHCSIHSAAGCYWTGYSAEAIDNDEVFRGGALALWQASAGWRVDFKYSPASPPARPSNGKASTNEQSQDLSLWVCQRKVGHWDGHVESDLLSKRTESLVQ